MTVKGHREGSIREKDIPGAAWRIQTQASSALPPMAIQILLLPLSGTGLPAFQTLRRKARVLHKSQCLHKQPKRAGIAEFSAPGGQSSLIG